MAPPSLSRREREILDLVHRLGRPTAQAVREAMADPPSYSAVRTHLRILEEKGHLAHSQDGPRYVYHATVPTETAGRTALRHLVTTFFGGSPSQALAALLDDADDLSDGDLDRLSSLIQQAREEGR